VDWTDAASGAFLSAQPGVVMRFVPVCCPHCGLSFSVILSGRHRSARVDWDAWRRICLRASEAAEPRLCGDFRAVVMSVLSEGETLVLVGEKPPKKQHRKLGPGCGHKGKMNV
jgi:hypothetical protein